MTHASVFSGIGGPEVAAAMLGWDNLFHCEINPFGRRVLDYWFPNSESYEDITKTDFTKWRGKVDVLTGGFPCQPFSYAGQRRGASDDRYLWPYMFRCIDQIRPTWVVAENVAGITTMVEQGEVSEVASQATLFGEKDTLHRYQLSETFTLERICRDLESHGYSVQPILIPACAVGAPHRRDRVFIVANANDRTDRRTAGEDEGTGREERIQERHEVRKPDEPNQVLPTSAWDAITNALSRGKGASRTGDGSESGGCGQNQQPSEWRTASEWNHRFYELLRPSADSTDARLQHGHQSEGESGEAGTIQGQGSRTIGDVYAQADGNRGETTEAYRNGCAGNGRWEHFPSVSPVHRGNDGLPFDVDRLTLSFGKWRTEALKAYGNAIVPQVMYEIFRAIEMVEKDSHFLQKT